MIVRVKDGNGVTTDIFDPSYGGEIFQPEIGLTAEQKYERVVMVEYGDPNIVASWVSEDRNNHQDEDLTW